MFHKIKLLTRNKPGICMVFKTRETLDEKKNHAKWSVTEMKWSLNEI